MDNQDKRDLEAYHALRAMKSADVDLIETNIRYKQRNKSLNNRLGAASNEKEIYKKSAIQNRKIIEGIKKFLNNESEMGEFVNIPILIEHIKELERVVNK